MAWLDWVIVAQSTILLIVAFGLLTFSRRTLPTLLLTGWLVTWAIHGGYIAVIGLLGADRGVGATGTLELLIWFVSLSTGFAFAVVYPNLGLTRWRLVTLVTLGVFTLGIVVWIFLLPWTSEAMRPVWNVRGVYGGVTGLLPTLILGYRWLHSRSEPYRMQVVWALLAFIFWAYNDGLPYNLYPLLRGDLPQMVAGLGADGWWAISWMLHLLEIVVAFGLAGVAISRTVRGSAGASDRAFALLTPFLLAFSAAQIFWGFTVHIVLDYIPAALIIYGVARFNVVDLDIKLKLGLRRGTVAAMFIAVFFVVSEFAAVLFGDLAGSAGVGILAAGGLVLFIAPLQRVADRFAQQALPNVEDTEAYRHYRRFQIYRVALEGTLQDGVIDTKEARTLANLRAHLGLTDSDHEALEQEIRGGGLGLSAPMPAGPL